jgi:hypothetical protein
MLLSTSLCLSSTQLPEDIDSPTEWIVVPGVLVQLIKSGKLLIGDDEIYMMYETWTKEKTNNVLQVNLTRTYL